MCGNCGRWGPFGNQAVQESLLLQQVGLALSSTTRLHLRIGMPGTRGIWSSNEWLAADELRVCHRDSNVGGDRKLYSLIWCGSCRQQHTGQEGTGFHCHQVMNYVKEEQRWCIKCNCSLQLYRIFSLDSHQKCLQSIRLVRVSLEP